MLLQTNVVAGDFLLAFIFVFSEETLISDPLGLFAYAARTQFLGRFLGSFHSLKVGDFATTHVEDYEQNYKISIS